MISKQFLKSSFIYSAVGALPFISGIILIPFFTNLLTTDQFGANALYFTFLYFIQIFSTFSLDFFVGVSYFDYRDNTKKLGELLGTVLISLSFLAVFILIILFLCGKQVFWIAFRNASMLQFFPFGFLTVLTAIFNGFFKTYSNLLINQQRPQRFFWLNLTNFLMIITFSLLILKLFPFTLYGPILGRMIPSLVTFCIVLLMIFKEYLLAFRKEFIRSILSFCFPLLVYTLSIWIVNYIDRYIIYYFIKDITIVGIYDIAVKIVLTIDFFQIGLNSSIQPKVFSLWKKNDTRTSTPEMNRYYNGFTGATMIIIPLLVISVPLIVPFIISKPIYYYAFTLLPILSLGFATRGLFYMFISPIFYYKKTSVLPKIFLFVAIVQIIISTTLIHFFSIQGAVWASFLIKPVQVFFLWLESRKIFKFRFNKWKIIWSPLLFIFYVLVTEIFRNAGNSLFIGLSQLLVSALLVWFSYRKELIPMIRERLRY